MIVTPISFGGPYATRGIAPTNPDGETVVPIKTFDDLPESLELVVEVQFGDLHEVLFVRNVDARAFQGKIFSVTVTDTDAQAPPTPVPVPVVGTSPARLEITGYVGSVGVCSTQTGEVAWMVYLNTASYYVDAITVGSVPDGYWDTTFIPVEVDGVSTEQPRPCPVLIDAAPENAFVAFARPVFGRTYASSDAYCLNEVGAVVACETD